MFINRTKTFYIILSLLVFPSFLEAQVVVNEIVYSPTTKQWVEIYNGTDQDIDITQHKILDAGAAVNGHGISAISGGENIIPAHAYGVIAKDPTSVSATYLFKASLGIKTSGDTISLKSGSSVLDSYSFVDSTATNGTSLQRQTDGSWKVASITPGLVNSSVDVVIETSTSTASTTEQTTNENSSNGSSNQTESVSVHYSSAPLTKNIPEISFKVGAGRNRLVTVDTPIEFKAQSNSDYTSRTIYKWSFGDGAIGYGEMIDHSYAYPGEYVVVLSAISPFGQAVSRVEVKVIPADFSVVYADSNRVDVKNNTNYETNMFGRAIEVNGKSFSFPEDTIIKPKQQISFANSITRLQPTDPNSAHLVVLKNQINQSNTSNNASNFSDKTEIDNIYVKVQALQKQIASLSQGPASISSPSPSHSNQINQSNVASVVQAVDSLESLKATTTISKKNKSWFNQLKKFLFGQ